MNKKKIKKILYKLQLTKSEERILLESFSKRIDSIAWTIIKNAHDRGDLKITKFKQEEI